MKIEEQVLEHKHIGETVTYLDGASTVDVGKITSFNDEFVFVKYESSNTSQATRAEKLFWGDVEDYLLVKIGIIQSLKLNGMLNINDFEYEVNGLISKNNASNVNINIYIKGSEVISFCAVVYMDIPKSPPIVLIHEGFHDYSYSDVIKREVKMNLIGV